MRTIDADALKGAMFNHFDGVKTNDVNGAYIIRDINVIIDNAPTVEPTFKPIAEVKFDKEQLQAIVDVAKAEVLASVERPAGKWVGSKEYVQHLEETTGERYIAAAFNMLFCNNCWETPDSIKKTNFCPNCGAKMKGGAE